MHDFEMTKESMIRELVELRRLKSSLEKDLTRASLLEESLLESESRYRGLIENMPIVCYSFDREGRVLAWNWAAEDVYGYRKDQALGRLIYDLIATAATREATEKVVDGVFQGESYVGLKWNDRNREGVPGWRVGNAFPILRGNGEVEAGVSLVIDITAQEQAAESLRRSEEKYRDLVEHSGSLIMRVDTAGRITFFNEFAQRFFGWSEQEILGRHLLGTIVPLLDSTGADTRSALEDRLARPERYAVHECENVTRGGERVWVLWTRKAVLDDSGRVSHIFEVGQDITQRRKAEEQLRKLSYAVEQSPSVIVVTDLDGCIEYVNPKFTEMTGYSPEEVVGKAPRILKSGDHPSDFYRRLWLQISSGQIWRGEFHNRRKDGELYWESASISPVINERGEITHYIKVAEDRTQIRQLEEQLQLRQRMDSLGTLAGGIAHDFNNLLTGILGNLSLMEMDQDDLSGRQREYLQEAERSCQRASDLIRQFQSLTRSAASRAERTDVYDIAVEVFKLLGETTDRMIEKRIGFGPGLFFVMVDPSELHQVLLNLGTNSVQAVVERGVRQGDYIALLASGYTSLGHEDPTGLPGGRYVQLVFCDTGVGMSDEVKRRAFEPLFTTRGKEKRGQGLGLSMVYNIICNKSNGFIEIDSVPGRGTAINIYLPEVASGPTRPVTPVSATVRGGSETVLVVEDEELVRNLACRILESYGYRVLSASDGQEGLEVFARELDNIGVVVLDLTMPRMSGTMTFARLEQIQPEVRVIICTGHSDEDARRGILTRAKAFLTKPYQAEELARAVRKVLDEAPAGVN
ncbi:PAS domain S-box protein [bacterium]|nr:PAS domain S-box protein [bacterium]